MTLYDGEKGGCYEVCGVHVDESISRRLHALGPDSYTHLTLPTICSL